MTALICDVMITKFLCISAVNFELFIQHSCSSSATDSIWKTGKTPHMWRRARWNGSFAKLKKDFFTCWQHLRTKKHGAIGGWVANSFVTVTLHADR